ncbi:MAG: recombination-associated protein RdgC [Gammaproteobacteria bacterium]|nr:recombination-associated protein RdgC [Gammaproteobacteria bacterium]
MWFKNLQLFRLHEMPTTDAEALETQLAGQAFRDCGSLEFSTEGWVSPLGLGGETLVHAAGGFLLVCACRQEKLLPPSVVNELVAGEVLELERQRGGRKLPRRDRQAVKESIVTRLLPAALPRNRRTWAVIDPRGGWLWIDSSSRTRAEELVTLLRESLGKLRAVPPEPTTSPAARLTRWLGGDGLPDAFALGEQCELRDPLQENRVVRCRGLDLAEEEVQAHVAAGMHAVRLALTWHDRVAFTIDAELSLRGLQFLDEVRDARDDVVAESEAERFDADFAIMTHELSQLVPELLDGFGAA